MIWQRRDNLRQIELLEQTECELLGIFIHGPVIFDHLLEALDAVSNLEIADQIAIRAEGDESRDAEPGPYGDQPRRGQFALLDEPAGGGPERVWLCLV